MATRPMQSFLRRYGWRLDRALIKLSNGHLSMSMAMPEVLLTHTGAKSGQQRSTPLTYFTDGGRVIVIASNYGDVRHPGLVSQRQGESTSHTLVPRLPVAPSSARKCSATNVTGCSGWPPSYMPNYAGYQKTTKGRRIPVVAFTEVD